MSLPAVVEIKLELEDELVDLRGSATQMARPWSTHILDSVPASADRRKKSTAIFCSLRLVSVTLCVMPWLSPVENQSSWYGIVQGA